MELKRLNGTVIGCGDIIREIAEAHKANLQDAYLKGADLSCANLRGADLSCANLRGADLSCANLSCANLRGANLRGADLEDADLEGARLRGAMGIVSFGPVGKVRRVGYAVDHGDGVMVQLGCWWGDSEKAIDRIESEYPEGAMRDAYVAGVRWAVQQIEAYREVAMSDDSRKDPDAATRYDAALTKEVK